MISNLLCAVFAAIARFAIAAFFSRKKTSALIPENRDEVETTLEKHDL